MRSKYTKRFIHIFFIHYRIISVSEIALVCGAYYKSNLTRNDFHGSTDDDDDDEHDEH